MAQLCPFDFGVWYVKQLKLKGKTVYHMKMNVSLLTPQKDTSEEQEPVHCKPTGLTLAEKSLASTRYNQQQVTVSRKILLPSNTPSCIQHTEHETLNNDTCILVIIPRLIQRQLFKKISIIMRNLFFFFFMRNLFYAQKRTKINLCIHILISFFVLRWLDSIASL